MTLASPRPLANGLPSRSKAAWFLRGLVCADRHQRNWSVCRPYQDIHQVIRRLVREEELGWGVGGGVSVNERTGREGVGRGGGAHFAVRCPGLSRTFCPCMRGNPWRLEARVAGDNAADAFAEFAHAIDSSYHLRGKRGEGGPFLSSKQRTLGGSKSSAVQGSERLGGGGWHIRSSSSVFSLSLSRLLVQKFQSTSASSSHSESDSSSTSSSSTSASSSSSLTATSSSSSSSSPSPSQPLPSSSTVQPSPMSPSLLSLPTVRGNDGSASGAGGRRSISTAAAADAPSPSADAVRSSTSLKEPASETSLPAAASSLSIKFNPSLPPNNVPTATARHNAVEGQQQEGGVGSSGNESGPYVLIGNPEELERKKRAIRQGGRSKLQVIADFDMTLTRFKVNGRKGQTCHALVVQENPEYDRKRQQLYEHYYPLEICPNLSYEDKFRHMEEWWTKAHNLLVEGGLQRSSISASVGSANIDFREGCKELFALLEEEEVPLLIFSAGLADIIEEVMMQRIQRQFGNVTVVSNRMAFDEQGKLTGFVGKTIHILNKNEHALELMMLAEDDHDAAGVPSLVCEGNDHEDDSEAVVVSNGNGAVGGMLVEGLGGEAEEDAGGKDKGEEEENGASVSWRTADRNLLRISSRQHGDGGHYDDVVVDEAGFHNGGGGARMDKAEKKKPSMRARTNVLLLGDHIGDLGMSDGLHYENRITVGFLNDSVETRSSTYMKAFDVVVVGDGPMTPVVDLLREVLL